MIGRHTLVLGGARSGKSAYAERLALSLGATPAYLATSQAFDAEMDARIARHRADRDDRFSTIEEALDLMGAISEASRQHDVILVDCLTLWISNLMATARSVDEEVDALVTALPGLVDCSVVLVSNEVGLGIVPDNAMARAFRDQAGRAHQRLATVCENVIFVAAGLPIAMKGTLSETAS